MKTILLLSAVLALALASCTTTTSTAPDGTTTTSSAPDAQSMELILLLAQERRGIRLEK